MNQRNDTKQRTALTDLLQQHENDNIPIRYQLKKRHWFKNDKDPKTMTTIISIKDTYNTNIQSNDKNPKNDTSLPKNDNE